MNKMLKWLLTKQNRKGGIGVVPVLAISCGLIVGTVIVNMVVDNFSQSTSFNAAYNYLTGRGYTVIAGSPTTSWNPSIDNTFNLGTAALRWKDIRGVDSTVTGTATVGGLTATANLDIGSFEMRAQTFESDVATGTSPFTVASTTKVTNLNADLVDGYAVGRGYTFTVAASDSSVIEKAQADYIADGIADQVQIQAAIDALPTMGGTVRLAAGTYALNDEVLITQPGVAIIGAVGLSQYSPRGTYLSQGNANKNIFHFNPATRSSPYVLKNLTLVGAGAVGTGNGIYSQRNTNSVVLEDIFIATVPNAGIRFEDDGTGDPWTFTNILLNRVEIETNGSWGAYFKQTGKNMNIIRITASHFVGGAAGNAGLYVEGATEFQMIGGMAENNTGYGIYLKNNWGVTISGQKFYNWDQGSSSLYSALYLTGNQATIISNNIFVPYTADSKAAIESVANTGPILIEGNILTPPIGGGSLIAPVIASSGSEITWKGTNYGFGEPAEKIFTLSQYADGEWSTASAGGASVVQNNDLYATLRNADAVSSVSRAHHVTGLGIPTWSRYAVDWDKPLRIRVSIAIDGVDANRTAYFLVHEGNTTGDLGDKGLGLKITGAIVTGMGFNTVLGTTGTIATLTSGGATTIEIVLVPGLGLFFNVEGLPVGSLMNAAQFPSGESNNAAFVVESHATSAGPGFTTDFEVSSITFSQGWKN